MTDESPSTGSDRAADGAGPVSRREFVAGSMLVGASVVAGCTDGDATATGTAPAETTARTVTRSDGAAPLEPRDTVVVFNTGDDTVSIVDAETAELVETVPVGLSSSFPSNQYTPSVVDGAGDSFWVNVGRGVRALGAGTLDERARVDTGSGANWQERTPDGAALVVSAREPTHAQYEVDADPTSESFGAVVAEIDRSGEGGRGDHDGPGPCDVTVHPGGEYAYVPDLYGDTLTVLDLAAFAIETQVDVAPLADGGAPKPWMATVAPDGERLLVEHQSGIETLWDVSDPGAPDEVARLASDDGLGNRPLTSEVSADGSTGYVFTPGTGDVTVVDVREGAVVDRVDLGGQAFTGAWDPARDRLYAPVQTDDAVAVIDDETASVVSTVDVGSGPYGATAATVRPDPGRGSDATAVALESGADGDPGTTYCIDNCACGHEL